jgi:hypothetical protein
LTVCPLTASAIVAASSASGMLTTTTTALRQSRKNSSTISPVSSAPIAPSSLSPRIARVTYGLWSNW